MCSPVGAQALYAAPPGLISLRRGVRVCVRYSRERIDYTRDLLAPAMLLSRTSFMPLLWPLRADSTDFRSDSEPSQASGRSPQRHLRWTFHIQIVRAPRRLPKAVDVLRSARTQNKL